MNAGKNALTAEEVKLGDGVFAIRWVVHKSEMFQVIDLAGDGMFDGKIRIDGGIAQTQGTLVAEGNAVCVEKTCNHSFGFGAYKYIAGGFVQKLFGMERVRFKRCTTPFGEMI